MQCLEPPTGAANPAGERGSFQFDPVAREDLSLPIERRVIAIFARQHVRDSAGGRALWNPRLPDRTEFATRPTKGKSRTDSPHKRGQTGELVMADVAGASMTQLARSFFCS